MPKKSRQQSQETTLDASTQAALDDYRKRAAQRYSQTQAPGGPDAAVRDYSMGALGFGAETGLNNISDYFNPYQEDVINGVHTDFNHQRAQAGLSAADQATKSGAFGGSRSAVLQGVLQNGVNENEARTTAGLRQSGYDNAVGNLMTDRSRSAQLGLGGYGAYNQNVNAAQGGMGYGLGFGGSTTTQTQTPSFWDIINQWAGNAAALGSAFVGGGGKK